MRVFYAISIIFIIFKPDHIKAQINNSVDSDSLKSRKEIRKDKKRKARKDLNYHFLFSGSITYAFLNTQVRFTTPNKILSFQFGVEDNLGLPSSNVVIPVDLIWRITPRSGIFFKYYGLKRNSIHVLNNDICLPGDTIFAGTSINTYFYTNIYSFGYLFTILDKNNTYLGAFANIYIMNVRTGIKSEPRNYWNEYQILAPLPFFGIIVDIELVKWVHLSGSVGTLYINDINGFGSTINDFSILLSFFPTKWLVMNVGYQSFNLNVHEKTDNNYNIDVTYSFKGPAAGLGFRF